ncbi:hypothetical protein ACVXG9_23735 [Escherichia coli]
MYTGGTLAAEAAGLLAGHLGVEADDTHHHGMMLTPMVTRFLTSAMISHRRASHPMIDPALRNR